MQKIILITTMLIALIINSCALPDEPETEIKTIKEINVVESYYQSPKINDIADDDQFIWCATDDGIVRIDKITNEKKLYNSNNSAISSAYLITVDNNKTVWVLGNYKILYKIADSEDWIQMSMPSGVSYINNLQVDSKNQLWILAQNSVYTLNYSNWTKLDGTTNVKAMSLDKNDNLWFCDYDSLSHLKLYNGYNTTVFDMPDTLKHYRDLTSISVNKNLQVAIGTYSRGFAVFNQSQWQMHYPSTYLSYHNVSKIEADSNNNFWMIPIYDRSTIVCLKPTGENVTFNEYNTPIGRSDYRSMHCDLTGRMLFGTSELYSDSRNIRIYHDNTWKYSSCIIHPLPSSIHEMLTDKSGNVWLAGNNGITKISNGNWQFHIPEDSINQINGLEDINSMVEDADGRIWFGTDGGVVMYYNNKFEYITYSNSNLPYDTQCCVGFNQFNTLTIVAGNNYFETNGSTLINEKHCQDIYSDVQKINSDWLISDNYAFHENYRDDNNILYQRSDLSNSPLSKILQTVCDNANNIWFVTQKDDWEFIYKFRYGSFYRYDWANMGFANNNYNYDYRISNNKKIGLTAFNSSRVSLQQEDGWQPFKLYWNSFSYSSPQNLCWQNSKTLWLTDGNRLFKAEVQE